MDTSLKYNIIEKQAFSLVKELKDFRFYILHSHIIAFVLSDVVKYILAQIDLDWKRGKWIVVILEYDIEIRPTNLIKGQGLAKIMVESNFHALDINFIVALDEHEELVTPQVSEAFATSPWYIDMIFVL